MTEALIYTFSTDDTLDAAYEYADKGYPVFPVRVWPDPETPGKYKKKPLTDNGHHSASTDPERIRKMFEGKAGAGIGIPTGAETGLVVLDTDTLAAEEWLQQQGIPAGPMVKTNNGFHRYYAHPGGYVKGSTKKLFDGLDVKADGGWVVVPDSPGYSWQVELNGYLPPLPEWVLENGAEDKPASSKPANPDYSRSRASLMNKGNVILSDQSRCAGC